MNKRDLVPAQSAQRDHRNSLLAALPHAEYQRLLADLEPITLKFGEVLHEPSEPIRHAYFPVDSVVVLQRAAKGRRPLTVALVGHEGMVGIPLALGIETSHRRAFVQSTGTALRMESALFRKAILRSKPLQQVLFCFKHVLMGQVEQSAVCKQFHSTQERLVRYLLMTSERARSNEIRLTQEFLGDMLGVRRTSVVRNCSDLQKRALIKHNRGKITIRDRKHLSVASCECYQIVNRIYESAYANV
jgi:CRP-like cAMP-binding protein